MNITIVFFIGLVIGMIGVIPPGLLNMTAAKISLKDGYNRGVIFSVGVCVVVIAQTYIAMVLGEYLTLHPGVVEILQRVALVLFVLITIYFLVIANKNETPKINPKISSIHSRFFQGMFMSALNMFPIPFHAYMTVTLSSWGWLNFEPSSIASYVAGVASGTFAMLYVYIFFFDKIKGKALTSQKNMNLIIGGITGVISLITFINILKDL
ncbi:MAG: lysine transporter LysE [Bacteroidetes bacterium MedPE-SWsnd-G2]|nr:MAG: lysine transporter LysE [Bacteroidetes bacterium MedPE-SWsnd-G2]